MKSCRPRYWPTKPDRTGSNGSWRRSRTILIKVSSWIGAPMKSLVTGHTVGKKTRRHRKAPGFCFQHNNTTPFYKLFVRQDVGHNTNRNTWNASVRQHNWKELGELTCTRRVNPIMKAPEPEPTKMFLLQIWCTDKDWLWCGATEKLAYVIVSPYQSFR
jgi:hypothetical protein